MSILAIDPGPTESAYVQWDGAKVLTAIIRPNIEILAGLLNIKSSIQCVCERIECFGMAVGREVFETVYWSGRFWQAVSSHEIGNDFFLMPRREVKMHLCQSMRAKDANIRQALIDRFGAPGTKTSPGALYGIKSHLWSALAIAVTAHDNSAILEKCRV